EALAAHRLGQEHRRKRCLHDRDHLIRVRRDFERLLEETRKAPRYGTAAVGRTWPMIAFDASTRRAAGEPDDRLRGVADGVLATGETSKPMGENPTGRAIFSRGGHST